VASLALDHGYSGSRRYAAPAIGLFLVLKLELGNDGNFVSKACASDSNKVAGQAAFPNGVWERAVKNVNREGGYSDSGTSKLRRLKPDRAEPQRGTRWVQSLMAAPEMAGPIIGHGVSASGLVAFTNHPLRTRMVGGVGGGG
jgi:hypothetical protein